MTRGSGKYVVVGCKRHWVMGGTRKYVVVGGRRYKAKSSSRWYVSVAAGANGR